MVAAKKIELNNQNAKKIVDPLSILQSPTE